MREEKLGKIHRNLGVSDVVREILERIGYFSPNFAEKDHKISFFANYSVEFQKKKMTDFQNKVKQEKKHEIFGGFLWKIQKFPDFSEFFSPKPLKMWVKLG